MNYNTYKIAIFSLIFLFLSCEKNIDKIDINGVEHIGKDQISKIEIGVNSPVLDADGKSELKFKVKCKYTYKDKEFPLLQDRVPMNEIEVYASTGEKFNIEKSFSTKNIGNIKFYCKFKNITSNVVSVTSVTPVVENYTPIVIPIQVYVQYEPSDKANADNINEENFNKILDRANKVFAGKLNNAPSSTDSKITFKLIRIIKKEADVENREMPGFIYDNFMRDSDKYLTLWFTSGSSFLDIKKCIPQYTIEDPKNIPGLKLKKVNSFDEINTLLDDKIENATSNWVKTFKIKDKIQASGIVLTYSNFTSMLVPKIGLKSFERIIGEAYGLLNTGNSDEGTENYVNGDLDYCPDTFSYYSHFPGIEKEVFIPKDKQDENTIRNFYNSFNIMDNETTGTTISRDQIKRIRQVIKDCPFRQMKL